VPECQKIKNGGLDHYDPERFGRLIFAIIGRKCGNERVNCLAVHQWSTTQLRTGDRKRILVLAASVIASNFFTSLYNSLPTGLGQATYTCVPLSPSSIFCYRPSGGDLFGWESNRGLGTAAYTTGFVSKSPAGWLPRNRDQLRAQHS